MDVNGNGNGHHQVNGNGHSEPLQPVSNEKFIKAAHYSREKTRERRARVADSLVLMMFPKDIWRELKDEFDVDYGTIRKDCAIIRRYWKADDEKQAARRRENALRRYARVITITAKEKKWADCARFEALYAQVSGILGATNVHIGDRKVEVHAQIIDHSRVVNVLGTLSADERRRIANSLAVSERDAGAAPPPVSRVPLSLGDGTPPGTVL